MINWLTFVGLYPLSRPPSFPLFTIYFLYLLKLAILQYLTKSSFPLNLILSPQSLLSLHLFEFLFNMLKMLFIYNWNEMKSLSFLVSLIEGFDWLIVWLMDRLIDSIRIISFFFCVCNFLFKPLIWPTIQFYFFFSFYWISFVVSIHLYSSNTLVEEVYVNSWIGMGFRNICWYGEDYSLVCRYG